MAIAKLTHKHKTSIACKQPKWKEMERMRGEAQPHAGSCETSMMSEGTVSYAARRIEPRDHYQLFSGRNKWFLGIHSQDWIKQYPVEVLTVTVSSFDMQLCYMGEELPCVSKWLIPANTAPRWFLPTCLVQLHYMIQPLPHSGRVRTRCTYSLNSRAQAIWHPLPPQHCFQTENLLIF